MRHCAVGLWIVMLLLAARAPAAEPWRRHVIDDSSVGADGVRLADVNGDGFQDITTGWEEGGVIRVYMNPGPLSAKDPWPAVTVGKVDSPEDAVFADLDGDGTTDVVSSCEGEEQTVFAHWAPKRPEDYWRPEKWRTEELGESRGRMKWMYSLPLEIDYRRGVDLVSGGKGPHGQIGWFESPPRAREAADWKWHGLRSVGWLMSLIPDDMDGDGDLDIVASDRKGEASGAFWLENPGPGETLAGDWSEHEIGGSGFEVMFIAVADVDSDGLEDVLSAIRPKTVLIHRREDRSGLRWSQSRVALPASAGTAKSVAVGDIDLNGRSDIVFSCEHADGTLSGVMWFSYSGSLYGPAKFHDISGGTGVKFDRVELIDLDEDGDLDVLTCEENTNLGVIWYENPAH